MFNKRFIYSISVLIIILFVNSAEVQNGTFNGKAIDAGNDELLIGANIIFEFELFVDVENVFVR